MRNYIESSPTFIDVYERLVDDCEGQLILRLVAGATESERFNRQFGTKHLSNRGIVSTPTYRFCIKKNK